MSFRRGRLFTQAERGMDFKTRIACHLLIGLAESLAAGFRFQRLRTACAACLLRFYQNGLVGEILADVRINHARCAESFYRHSRVGDLSRPGNGLNPTGIQ